MLQVKSQLIFGDLNTVCDPILSFLIPTYGRAEYLEQAIDSILIQCNKISCEIIVLSNDPNDNLQRLQEKYKEVINLYLYRNEKNIGMVNNSNRCVELARGKYIAFLHDDDYLLNNYISTIEEFFLCKENKAKSFIVGRQLLFEEHSLEYKHAVIKDVLRKVFFIPNIYRKRVRKMLVKYNLYSNMNCYFSPSCGTIIERESFMKIGGFDNKILYAWDFDFFLRFNLEFDIEVCSVPCAVYRIGGNASSRKEVKYDFYDFNRTKYLTFMKANNISPKFIDIFEDEIIYSVYQLWPDELNEELQSRNLEIPILKSKIKLFLFKFITLLYYYMNNLDIQRIMKKKKK